MESSSSLLPWRSAVWRPIAPSFCFLTQSDFATYSVFWFILAKGESQCFHMKIFAFIRQWKQRVTEKLEEGDERQSAAPPPYCIWSPAQPLS